MLSNKMDLRVAIITFPLNSKKQLSLDILNQYFNGNKELNEKSLARNELYKIINSRTTIINYDEIDLLMNKYHRDLLDRKYKEDKDNIYLYYYELIGKIADSFISNRDGKMVLKYWTSDEDKFLGCYDGLNKIAMWNTLNREIHVDLIVFKYMIDHNMEDYRYLEYYHSIVHIEDMQLEKVLSKGVAETHMHIGAGIDFETMWHERMNHEFSQDKLEDYKLVDIIIGEGLKNIDLNKYRLIAIVYRIILSKFIWNKNNDNIMEKFINENTNNEINLKYIIEDIISDESNYSKYDFKAIILKLKQGFNIHSNKNSIDKDEVYSSRMNKSDFLSSVFHNVDYKINTTLENILLYECLKYINKNGKEDLLFCKIFYKYILIKNIFFRVSTQDNSIKGLDRFTNSFRRSTNLFNKKDLIYLVIHTQVKNRNLEKIELRMSFPPKKKESEIKKDLKKQLLKFFEVYKELIGEYESEGQNKLPQIGIIYHFRKYEDNDDKCWVKNSIYKDYTKLYYEKHRREYMNQLNVMLELRNNIPYLSNYIVGIDAASVEHSTDPWVFSPIFKKARNSTYKIGNLGMRRQDKINTLGFTFHVGEEFRHILSGLRKIDEVIDHLKLKSGDRIGHGIALGIDIDRWIKNNTIVILPRIEYLENMLWMWNILTQKNSFSIVDIKSVERKIMDIAKDIYIDTSGLNIYNLYESYLGKFEDTSISDEYIGDIVDENERICYNSKDIFCSITEKHHRCQWDTQKVSHSNHCSNYLNNMNEPIEVKVFEESIELLKFIQQEVKKKISKEGIIVETNPTSNRSIGELDNIFEHYISNLNSVDKFSEDNIMVSINTDDPSVFNSNINNEYAYIFYSLIHKGYDRNTCLEWIDKIRKIAIENSFIKTRNIDIALIEKEIKDIMDYLK
ncbi:hypothetical protein [Paraclostridium sordellii]|uniref:hypothetical protein n=1 Tax=Paraclostridium sordellii TaxID=1505 RepID=UPI0005E02DE8|nr:hypothetical protein [Paeniclostridium sordellii]CEO26290.1 adenosine/AMP deaminase [[Clostridium] sordellii] [Paeniclostridium sordellii]